MRLRILNYYVQARHNSIARLTGVNDPVSISDFDAFICDLERLNQEGFGQPVWHRRQAEINALLRRKGGIVVCFLCPDGTVGSGVARYSLFSAAAPGPTALVQRTVRFGQGSQITVVRSTRAASTAYLQVLKGVLAFTAHLAATEDQVEGEGGAVLATDSAGYPVAVEFILGEGRLCLVPVAPTADQDRMGAAMVRTMVAHFNRATEVDSPEWAATVTVPGADAHDEEIAKLKQRSEEIAGQISRLTEQREGLIKYIQLLFGYGKSVLEPAVRSAFRLLGFAALEPEEYQGEWDVELHEPGPGRTALGEVEGSEGIIDVDKYRQLLDYVDSEALQGRRHKGLLIGNGFRQLPPEAAERKNQFSEHALRGAALHDFCLLPTTELFKAVCAVLQSPGDDSQKAAIRESILTTTGPWSFVREQSAKTLAPATVAK